MTACAQATDHVAGLIAHDATQAPLAEGLVFVENLERKQPGEVLWESSVAAPGTFVVEVPDATNQSVGYLAIMTRTASLNAPTGWE